MSIENLYPSVKPSLDLNFAAGNFDPRITFSRASGGTVYDGKTVAKAEENLLAQSQNLGLWTKLDATVTVNSGVAPDGTTTANTLIASATAAFHAAARSTVGVISSAVYQVSFYAKSGTYSLLQFFSNNAFSALDRVNFDLNTGTVTAASGAYSGATMAAVGNGWYRCVVPTLSVSSSLEPAVYLAITNSPTASRANTWLAEGTETILLWGAQVEQRSQATAYTPTTSQPITNYVPVLQTAPANVPRIDYAPVTGECKGLLIEEQRTNLLTYSEQFGNNAWSKNTATIWNNLATAPDGSLSADKLVLNAGANPDAANNIGIQYVQTIPSGIYTYSVYAKASEFSVLRIRENLVSGSFLNIDLLTGIPSGGGAQFVNPTTVSIGNGWWRISWTSPDGMTSTAKYLFRLASAGDGYSGVYIWGAQLELGTFPTSYIKTEASQVTRAADSASMTGANFSSWYRHDEGTLFSSVVSPNGVSARSVTLSDGTIANQAWIRNGTSGSSFALQVYTNSLYVAEIGTALAVSARVAAAIKSNDFSVSTLGSPVAADNSGYLPSYSKLTAGASYDAASAHLNGHIKRITYYPKRLSNTELQALTA